MRWYLGVLAVAAAMGCGCGDGGASAPDATDDAAPSADGEVDDGPGGDVAATMPEDATEAPVGDATTTVADGDAAVVPDDAAADAEDTAPAEVNCSPGCGPGETPACGGVATAGLVLHGEGGSLCAGAEAQSAFGWGLCACEDATFDNQLTIDAFDSRDGPWSASGPGGGLGANRAILASNRLAVSGSLWSAGAAGLTLYNTLALGQSLHLGGPLVAFQSGQVGGDAWVNGEVTAYNGFAIAGGLHQPPGATVTGAVTSATRHDDGGAAALPCRCETKALALPTALAQAHAPPNNDNGAIGLAADLLRDPPAATTMSLPCGLFYLAEIRATTPVTIVATGRAALFIGGDVVSSSALTVTTEGDGELDVFIAGTLEATGELTLGAPSRPARLRVYIGGTEPVLISNSAHIAAFLQAGRAELSLRNHADVFGGVLARRLVVPNVLAVHYDRAVLAAAAGCPNDSQACTGCGDCRDQACVDGTCGPCGADSDCCPPLSCRAGRCGPP